MLTWETNKQPELKGKYKYDEKQSAVRILLDEQQRATTLYMLIRGTIPPYYTLPEITNDTRGLYVNVETLGCVDGFDQDEAESKRDERAVILRRLLASKCDTLEAFELADSLFNACPCLVECFRKEGGHILGVGSIRDCRTYSALARGVAV